MLVSVSVSVCGCVCLCVFGRAQSGTTIKQVNSHSLTTASRHRERDFLHSQSAFSVPFVLFFGRVISSA